LKVKKDLYTLPKKVKNTKKERRKRKMSKKTFTRIEIDLPIQIYGFLEACAKFSLLELKYKDTSEEEKQRIVRKYIRDYITKVVVSSVKEDAENISGTPLWSYEDLNGIYGLDEVEQG